MRRRLCHASAATLFAGVLTLGACGVFPGTSPSVPPGPAPGGRAVGNAGGGVRDAASDAPGAPSGPLGNPAAVRASAGVYGPEQVRCEELLQDVVSPSRFREHLRRVTAEPHPTGSAAQVRVAAYLGQAMRAAGLTVHDDAYDVYLPQLDGLVNEVEIVTPVRMRLENREPAVAGDPFSGHPDLLPGWNAFSGSGDVTAEVVYANQGRKEDFEALERMGVDVRGKVVLARYGGNFRGHKVQFAEARGAVGVIMFNDPGTGSEPPYPEGRAMSPSTIQRGSVLTLPWTGDPLTPFEPALPLDGGTDVPRLAVDDVAFHTIPVLPIGYGAAREILERMQGDEAPAEWRSGVEVRHALTGGPALTVRVHVQQRLDFTRAVNVIGTLVGSDLPGEWVILGAHYDPWGFGAHDPNGGTAMLLTLADALGRLAREGCRPRRTIRIAHWDAEEYGIIGSTEWVEHYRNELGANAVAYINADAAVSGPNFGASSSPSLKQPILDAARAARYPDGGSVWEHWMQRAAQSRAATVDMGGRSDAQSTQEPPLGNLGGGSDHVAFYTHVGVPSAGLSFGGSNGIYHSNYDNFEFFQRFSDPEFVYGAALARIDGILALRLANARLVPYDVARYAADLRQHVGELEEMARRGGVRADFTALQAAVESLREAASSFERARAQHEATLSARQAEVVNRGLLALEKAFIHGEGLQDRPWSRSLYASPDPFSGYAAWMLPGLRYAVETTDAEGLVRWTGVYRAAVRDLEQRVRRLTALLEN